MNVEDVLPRLGIAPVNSGACWGEVQEMIDIADFATGLARRLYGLTLHSERPRHRMHEQWHPLGVVGFISAFNFPVALWSWNAFIAAVCEDCVLWKRVFCLVTGKGATVGEKMLADGRIPLVSATGSCRMGCRVAEVAGRRLGRTILDLGGNSGLIVVSDANLDRVLREQLFAPVLYLEPGIRGNIPERAGQRRVEGVHAPPDGHHQLVRGAAAGARNQIRSCVTCFAPVLSN